MYEFRKKTAPRTWLVCILCWSFLWLVYPRSSNAGAGMGIGSKTSDEAGEPILLESREEGFSLSGWKPALAFFHSSAAADTTELEFPEEEEEKREHLVRDIGIFIVLSAFLAYFLVKVFLEGEEEETPPEDNGKEIPGASRVTGTTVLAW